MTFNQFKETLRPYEIEGGFGVTLEKGLEIYYTNDKTVLGTKFKHTDKRKAFKEFKDMVSKLSSSSPETVQVAFKVTKYGEFKGDVTAIFPDLSTSVMDAKVCFALFEGHGECSNDWIRTQTRNAKPNEYSATKAVLEREYGYKLEVVNSIKY